MSVSKANIKIDGRSQWHNRYTHNQFLRQKCEKWEAWETQTEASNFFHCELWSTKKNLAKHEGKYSFFLA